MRVKMITILLFFFCSFFLCTSESEKVLSNYGYHTKVGIPKAHEIKLKEESTLLVKIVGGSESTLTAFPYQAGIVVTLITGWTSICGGALVSNTRVLTAAHCWWDGQNQAQTFTIVLGSVAIFTGGTRIETKDVTVHPNWNVNDITYDIAVVRIQSVTYNNNIQAIPLPSIADANQDFSGVSATVSGFGKTSDAQTSFPTTTSLQHATVTVIANSECQRSFEVSIHGSHLCTSGSGAVGTCDGDSGGPLTVVWNNQRTLIGIVSFGLGNGCQRGYPSVFTRVTVFLTWIQAEL